MAFDTFLPLTSFFRMRFDMKYSTDNTSDFTMLKYVKLFALRSVFVFLAIHSFAQEKNQLKTGADRLEEWLPETRGKCVGVVANQTSLVRATHLVDTLLSHDVYVVKVFSPEHGFRGNADAGQHVESTSDAKTGLPIVSLYGNNKKPTPDQLEGIDLLIFDIQDVGVRFYTYISTLHYVMEAAAENGIPVLVLDRPNPNGHYVDGPVLKSGFTSFVGMHPVPIVYGMTIGEYAQMINGECWLRDSLSCSLDVVPLSGYRHSQRYSLPVAPSPNLRTDIAVNLYPSLCLFEGTVVSVGRGTEYPFEVYGHPKLDSTGFSFVPTSGRGATQPKLEGIVCNGVDLRADFDRLNRLDLQFLLHARDALAAEKWINDPRFFNLLAGNDLLQQQLLSGASEREIRASWKEDLYQFKRIRSRYLLYK